MVVVMGRGGVSDMEGYGRRRSCGKEGVTGIEKEDE